ncbi:2'-5'-oligoadenylate synthase 1-like [Dreissena polymorpha]|uniref:C2H2-type domain-containing protein n=1 Tax=Dreissena polymorpha TaxID=45954 RepID=A0A9D4G3V0_DREPO|nr:2'-5'-oligoadenylate synthase 1-like [Dreissena polymorpha]XP_052217741.1 2'-5'-oligoadenylate synthase 1-like [Dreissena polymorpha]XP_052217742.1 2'-5'-oligoadenylate synthase 1-like [Dreissena polymorpha]XP_052217743.1 2'-5'-oligoadenylate synthase 1-like [Dreissena polymorpha]KAH3808361.1 hypothetical protein DPMN_136714 [Dreissena polymorpha]
MARPKPRPCPHGCSNRLFCSNKARRRHVHKHHGPVPDFCNECKEPFLSETALQHHNRDKHDNPLPLIQRISTLSLTNPAFGISSTFSTGFGGGFSNGFGGGLARGFAGASALSVGSTSSGLRTVSSIPCDLYCQTNLDNYIETTIQPDTTFLVNENAAVDSLVHMLQHNVPDEIRPARVIKGGSLGKGTAVKGKSDIDLTMMMSWERYPNVAALKANMKMVLPTLENTLRRMPNIRVDGSTTHAVQVTMTDCSGKEHAIDILPAVDLTQYESNETIFRRMLGPDSSIKAFYSASLAPLQVDLVRGLPTKVKSLIRLIKFWNKDKVKPILEDRCPTSYVYEIIIMDAWVNAGRPHAFDMKKAAHAVLTKLRNHRSLEICTPGISKYQRCDADIRHSTYIMDPCNPTNDIYNNRSFDWAGVAEEAKKWLDKQVFDGVKNFAASWY